MVTTNSNFVSTESVAARGFVPEDLAPTTIVTGRTNLAWGAVIAGALTSISLLILGAAFAYAVRIPVYIGGTYGVGAAIYGIAISIIAFFFGGMVVSYFSPRHEERVGLVHGMLAWVLAIPLMLSMIALGAGVFGGYLAAPFVHATTADGSMTVTAGVAWGAFLAMFLGLLSAMLGGIAGYLAYRPRH